MSDRRTDGEAETLIHRNLKTAFGLIEAEPLPPQLTDLIERLKQQEAPNDKA